MRKLILTVGILALAGGAVYVIGRLGIFEIKKISCQVDGEKECSAELNAELDRYLNRNLLSVRPSQIENRVISTERLVQSAKVRSILPDFLKVDIVSRRAVAAIITTDESWEAVEVDKEGIILGKTESFSELPRLIWPGISQWPIENPVPENIITAAKITVLAGERFKLAGIPKVEFQSSLAIKLSSGEKVWLSLAKDSVEQLAGLQVVLNQARIEGKQPAEIDLRFDNPVIK